jgi:hypothetical protein
MKHCSLLLFFFLLLGLTVSGQAQTAPDVLVLVVQRPGLGDQVDITYSGLIAHTQVQRDLDALRKASGWAQTGLKITDDRAPVQKVRYLTGATFTAPNVVQNETHTLPVEAFITAFRLYKNLALIFIVDSSFQFQGWRHYADNNVTITLDQHGAAYTYRAAILNSQFEHLGLPGTEQAAAAVLSRKKKARTSPLLLLLGIVLAAAAAGVLAFVVANRLTPAPLNSEKKPQEEKPQEEETTAGTRH